MSDDRPRDELIELPLEQAASWDSIDKGEERGEAGFDDEPPPARRRRWPWVLLLAVAAAGLWWWSAPRAEFAEESVGFEAQRVGRTSEPVAVRVTNAGWRALVIESVGVAGESPQSFRTVADGCSGSELSRGAECVVEVEFAPQRPGEHRGAVALTRGGRPWDRPLGAAELPLAGRAVAPGLAARPQTLDFGAESVGATSPGRDLELVNDGSDTLAIERVTLDGSDGEFRLVGNDCSGARLAPGESCTLRLVFGPRLLGRRQGAIEVASDAFGDSPEIPLVGRGSGPDLEIEPEGLDFGTQRLGTRSDPRTLTLANRGDAPMRISRLRIADGAAFRLEREDCSGRALGTGERCRAELTFAPTADGVVRSSLEIREASGGLAPGVGISGRGVSPRIELSPGGVDFGGVRAGEESAPRSVVVRNAGTASLAVTEARLSGDGASAFALLSDDCSGVSLDPGGRCQLAVAFRPARGGDRRARLAIRSNAPGEPPSADLSGRGLAPSLAVGRSRLDFAAVRRTESQDLQAEVANEGDAPLELGRIRIEGVAGADFSLASDGCTAGVLAPGQSCWLVVRFSPRGEGPRDGRLLIESNAVDGERSVILRGLGLPAPEPAIEVRPLRLDFGAQPTGERSEVLTVEVTSSGRGRLELESIRVDGPQRDDFRVVPGTCQGLPYVASGGDCTFGVRFVPGAVGERTARLVIDNNAPTGAVEIALSGEGL